MTEKNNDLILLWTVKYENQKTNKIRRKRGLMSGNIDIRPRSTQNIKSEINFEENHVIWIAVTYCRFAATWRLAPHIKPHPHPSDWQIRAQPP